MRSRLRTFAIASGFSILALSMIASFSESHAAAAATPAGNDEAPVVKITAPDNNSTYSWNSLVNFDVVVSYQGKSTQYQEIPSNEVLITTTYLPDLSKAIDKAKPAAEATPPGLLAILRSNCIGCHEFKAKAMGPSFAAIAARYPDSPASIDTLSRYIREGSTGVWGQASMPPHPELTQEQAQAMALWMVKDAGNRNVNYYIGTQGAIRMEAPETPSPNAGLLVSASYTAPLQPAGHAAAPQGEESVIVHGR